MGFHRNLKDEIGKTYGRLTVISHAESIPHNTGKSGAWLCQCSCGKTAVRRGSHLRKGTVRSCGCLALEVQRERGRKHQMIGTNARRINPIGSTEKRITLLNNIRNVYGLFPAEFDALMIASNGLCDICGERFKNNRQDCNIDHNHDTGKVRGLLCQRCNALLAGLEDKKFCVKATLYLQQKDGDVL